MNDQQYLLFKKARNLKKRLSSDEEAVLFQTAEAALSYCHVIVRGPIPEAESVIATDAVSAVSYATTILRHRFALAEPLIADDMNSAYNYCNYFKFRLLVCEEKMLMHHNFGFWYSLNVLNLPKEELVPMAGLDYYKNLAVSNRFRHS